MRRQDGHEDAHDDVDVHAVAAEDAGERAAADASTAEDAVAAEDAGAVADAGERAAADASAVADAGAGAGAADGAPRKSVLVRRTFIGLCVAVAGSCVLGGVTVAFAGENKLLRPPGAQDEQSFIAACVKCDRCRSVCPTGVVGVASIEDGFLRARTPTLNFHRGYCIFCDKCREVCSTGALKSFDPAEDKIGVAIIQRDRCIAYNQGCESCKDSCEYGALTFDSNHHPVIDAQLCNGCGACENQCVALVYGTFAGGTRRGIVVVTPEEYEALGTTLVDGEEA